MQNLESLVAASVKTAARSAWFGVWLMLVASAAAGEPDAFDGVWRSNGYGWLWQVEAGRVTRFDVGPDFCIRKRPADHFAIAEANRPQLSEDGNSLRLLQEDPDYFYTFERVGALPENCKDGGTSADPRSVLEVAIETIEAHYAFFDQRRIDWPKLANAARAAVNGDTTGQQLFEVFREMLVPFGDGHVSLDASIDGKQRSFSAFDPRPREQARGPAPISGAWNYLAAEALLGEDAQWAANDSILYGRFSQNVGYLFVSSMAEIPQADLEGLLDSVFKTFDGASAVIVDVSLNDGGFDSYARRIARRFAAEPVAAYSKKAGDFPGDEPQVVRIEPPMDKPRFTGPVYLITSADTYSAAEIFTLAMRALPNVVHLGETTDGSLSDELWKTLPNGWTLSLSNEVYLDSEGELWEGRGIVPEIPLSISKNPDDFSSQETETVERLVDAAAKSSLR
jgi:carboxyl-terminal processing protease